MPNAQITGTRPNTWGNFGAGLAQGIGQSYENMENLSIAQKMGELKQQQARNQYEYLGEQARKSGMPEPIVGLLKGGVPIEVILKTGQEYPQLLGSLLNRGQDGQVGQGGLHEIMGGFGEQPQQQPITQRQMFQPEGQMIPGQQPGMPQQPQEMPTVQRTQSQTPITQPKAILPSYDQLESQLHNAPLYRDASVTRKNQLDSQLKSRYDAQVKGRQLETAQEELGLRKEKDLREAEKHEKEMETEPRKYIEDVEKRASGWKKQKINMQFMAKNAHKITDTASMKKMLMEKFGIAPGMILNEPEQAMEKFASANMQGVSQAFPGQIKVVEFENFVKSHASLLNSPEFIQNMSNVGLKTGELIEDEFKESQKLRQEYRKRKERLPEDFHAQIEQKLQPKFDALGGEIDKIMNQKLPSSFKKWQPKNKFSGKKIQVTKPDGTVGMIPEELKDEFVKKGYTL